ncbi:amidohydrolase family protein [Kribbella sp. NPDC051620]|uniref:amidohydrolase family protein n=1 Tax=Kribbella sp. NPDC051620 TaxID=3364120 RepID=UPI00378B5199
MGSIQLHGLHPDWSLLELRRLARRRWVAGASVRVPADVPVWDPCLRPIFAALEDADLPLFHCSELYDSPGFPGHDDLWSDPHLAMTLGPSWDSQRQLTALVVGSVLDRHSRLKVCVLDGGVGWVPAWLDRLTYVSAQAGAAAKALLREGRITLTIAPHESERTVAAAVEVLGDRCLVWGSAFPRGEHRGPAQVRHWRSIRAESVLATNALRLLGLPHTEVQQQKKESTP